MLERELSNGVLMPVLGLGTFKVDEGNVAYDTVLEALRLGYRHIDTAQLYHNEASVGKAIKDSGLKRSDIFITTKLSPVNLGFQEAIDELEISLKKLGTDYVDLYLVHWPSPSDALNQQTWRGMEVCYERGMARAIGVSNYKIHHLDAILRMSKVTPMANQVELHPGLYQIPLQDYLNKMHIALISYGPLMKGEIFDKNSSYYETLNRIAEKHKATIAQVVIAWGLARNVFMIPKTVTPKRLKENYDSLSVKLDEEDVVAINKLNRGKRVYTDPDNNSFVKQA